MADPDPVLLTELLQESMQQGKPPYLTVASSSMAPLLRPGDQVQLDLARAVQLEVGDIIVIRAEKELIVHRFCSCLRESGAEYLITRGDRLRQFDAPTPASNLVGRVVAYRRQGRRRELKHGRGAWLHRQLVRLAAIDNRFCSRPVSRTDDDKGAAKQPQSSRGLFQRLLRGSAWRATQMLSSALVRLVTLEVRPKGRPE